MNRELTEKQKLFVQYLAGDPKCTATDAYRRAYPNCKSNEAARAAAARLLANVNVQDALQATRAGCAQKAGIESTRVLAEYQHLAFNDLRELFLLTPTGLELKPVAEWPESVGRSISGIKIRRELTGSGDDQKEFEVLEFKLWSKPEALAKLAQHLGLLDPKKPLQVDVTSGGKPLDRNSLTAADVAAAAALVGMAGLGVPADGGPKSVDQGSSAP